MEINPVACYENLRRSWRRRRHQRLSGHATPNRKKLRIMRLGGFNHGKTRSIPKLRLKILSPIKLLVKFHEAYVDTMIAVACYVGKINKIRALGGGRVAKSTHEVDSKLVMEIYERLAASQGLLA